MSTDGPEFFKEIEDAVNDSLKEVSDEMNQKAAEQQMDLKVAMSVGIKNGIPLGAIHYNPPVSSLVLNVESISFTMIALCRMQQAIFHLEKEIVRIGIEEVLRMTEIEDPPEDPPFSKGDFD